VHGTEYVAKIWNVTCNPIGNYTRKKLTTFSVDRSLTSNRRPAGENYPPTGFAEIRSSREHNATSKELQRFLRLIQSMAVTAISEVQANSVATRHDVSVA
jgi:hypothetical protein